MPSEKDLILVKLARDQRLVTEEHVQECISILAERRRVEPGTNLTHVLVEKDYLTISQLERLEKMRIEIGITHLVEGYEIVDLLGQGAVGSVYLARHVRMNRPVALKILSPSVLKDEKFRERFKREAQTTGGLSHPNIVQGYDVGESSGTYFFAMEYVDGSPLSEVMKGTDFTEHSGTEIVLQIGRALGHLHDKGFVHRDIKPENIMITKKGVAKLADLGLAKTVEGDSRVTIVGSIVGTPLYMSPEQARGLPDIDIRSDIYSLGVVYFQLVTGRLPFEEGAPTVIMTRHITEDIPLVRSLKPDVSPEVERVIRLMCMRERDRRYRTPRELVADLADILEGRNPEHASRAASEASARSTVVPVAVPEPASAPTPTRTPTPRPVSERMPARRPTSRRMDKVAGESRYRFCYVPTDDEMRMARLALKNALVTPQQLAGALDQQEEMVAMGFPRRLDEVLVEKGYLSARHQAKIGEALRGTQSREKDADRDRLFGRIAVEMGFATRDRVKEALRTQAEFRARGKDMKIGDILVKAGAMSPKDRMEVLAEQTRRDRAWQERRLGALAVLAGFVAPAILEEALARQEQAGPRAGASARKRLGETLVEMGAITDAQKTVLLRAQRRYELVGGDLRYLIKERSVDFEESGEYMEVASSSGLFDNLRLKSPTVETCPFCGEESELAGGNCGRCGKKVM